MLPRKVRRFDTHQRIQHFMVLSSFIICGLTGWPLRAAEEDPSMAIAAFFGGAIGCRLAHRAAGVLMLLALVYHIGYLGYYAVKRQLPLDMLPSPKDVRDVIHNMQYLLGFRKEPPDFGRWSYIEKFDYFAGAWGKFVMGTTGLILWFPVEASHYLPGDVLLLSQLFHGREALIAILSLFIWHMYNVHIRPGIWPMSRVWLDGMITMDELQHHHPAEFRKMYPDHAKVSHEQPTKKEGGAA